MKIIFFIVLFFIFYETNASWNINNISIKQIKESIENLEKKAEIIEDIESQKNILDKKVENIKEKIEENNQKLENKLNNSLEEKIKIKIKSIKENENYKKLNKEKRNIVFINFVKIIENRIFSIKKENITNSQKELKINILLTLKDIIEKEIVN